MLVISNELYIYITQMIKIVIKWNNEEFVINRSHIESPISFQQVKRQIYMRFPTIPKSHFIQLKEKNILKTIKDEASFLDSILAVLNKNACFGEQIEFIINLEIKSTLMIKEGQQKNYQDFESLQGKILKMKIQNEEENKKLLLKNQQENSLREKQGQMEDVGTQNGGKLNDVLEGMQNIQIQNTQKDRKIIKDLDQSSSSDYSESSSSSQQSEQDVKQFNKTGNNVIHSNVSCSKCKLMPIKGDRYKCATCSNYNLCTKCQKTTDHEHCFLKVKRPEMLPSQILNRTILKNSGTKWQFPQMNGYIGKRQAKQAKKMLQRSDQRLQALIISKTHQLTQLLDCQYQKCKKICQKYPELSIAELVDQYFRKANKKR